MDSWSASSREYPYAAFIEGWANFVNRVVKTGTSGDCSGDFDGNLITPIYSANPNERPNTNTDMTNPWDGKSYARNVTKLLCDWYDEGVDNDDDPNMAGIGDHFTAILYSIWYNLSESGIRYNNDHLADFLATGIGPGLDMCEYIDYYLNDRKSVVNVGQATHDQYVIWLSELAYNNGMKCGLPRP